MIYEIWETYDTIGGLERDTFWCAEWSMEEAVNKVKELEESFPFKKFWIEPCRRSVDR